jgi:hypothetical protein
MSYDESENLERKSEKARPGNDVQDTQQVLTMNRAKHSLDQNRIFSSKKSPWEI